MIIVLAIITFIFYCLFLLCLIFLLVIQSNYHCVRMDRSKYPAYVFLFVIKHWGYIWTFANKEGTTTTTDIRKIQLKTKNLWNLAKRITIPFKMSISTWPNTFIHTWPIFMISILNNVTMPVILCNVTMQCVYVTNTIANFLFCATFLCTWGLKSLH